MRTFRAVLALILAGLLLAAPAPASAAQPEGTLTVRLLQDPGGQVTTLTTASRVPADWLKEAGLAPDPAARLYFNGARVLDPAQPLPLAAQYSLQIRPSLTFSLQVDGSQQTLRSAAPTLGEALWEAGIPVTTTDRLSLPLLTPLIDGLQVTLQRARPVQIQAGAETVTKHTAALTVGEALAEAGISLQGLDTARPPESDPLPADGAIQVVRVREEILLEQAAIPYEKEYQPDPNVELDQRAVTQPGEFGIEVSRVRVRYEDGQETVRAEEARWVAKTPQNEIVGLGTQPVVKTLDTPDGPIEYYRAVTVYVTSYSPCRSGGDRCYPGTSLGLPVQRGVIGVTRSWYNLFAGSKLYVPGYGVGTIADTGGGVPGEYWIDLGYTDADYVPWHSYVTVYFLTPVPANIPWILP
jgi:uncharacterized protein YabE (DUF348 family)